MKSSDPIQYWEYSQGQWKITDTEIVVETPVSLTVNGAAWLTSLCTPVNLEALAVGFLYNEAVLESAAEIASVQVCASGDNVDVWRHQDVGRHNTLDKISGRMLLEGLSPTCKAPLTTGRASPGLLSVQIAKQWGLAPVGYAHRTHFNLYTHPKRIVLE